MQKTVFMVVTVQLFACAELRPEPSTSSSAVRHAIEARPCRADAFYVDVPLRLDPIWTDTSFLPRFKDDMVTAANVPSLPWFCGTGEITCPSTAVRVGTSAVLDPRPSAPFRGDGHLRFFRVRFFDDLGAPLSVRPAAQCDVVATIRTRFADQSGARPEGLFVGRECDANGFGAQAEASEEMLVWHLARMGLPSSSATVVAPPLAAQNVDLALVDSGVIAPVGTDPGGIGLASETDLLAGTAGLHAHGTAMAILTRQVAPLARLHSLRVLSASGAGTGEAVAAALDRALYVASSGTAPLVINMSLGWSSELGRSSAIRSPTCSSHEDPFGEPIRYLLDVARRTDEAGPRRVMVVAAAGNQPLPVPASLFPPPAAPAFPCSSASSSGQPWFFPAEWDRIDSCRTTEPSFTRVAFGVSVVDDRGIPASNAIPDAEAPLVAPGQHVYAAHPNAPPSIIAPGPQCGANAVFPPPVTAPRAFTGSSIGAALVSGAAARAQATRLNAGQAPFDAMTLARLLYLTGQDLCRFTPAGARVRRLHVGRLDFALAAPECAPLSACASSISALDPIPVGLLDACKAALRDCGLERYDAMGTLIPSCPSSVPAVAWPDAYSSDVCVDAAGLSLFDDADACAGVCPFADGSTRELVGSLGPQPGSPTCPDCSVKVQVSSAFDLYAELNDDFPAGTAFSAPYLVFQGPILATGMPSTVYLNLLAISAPASWVPGAFLHVAGTLDGVPSFDWSKTKAYLTMFVEQTGQLPIKDVSPLRLKIN